MIYELDPLDYEFPKHIRPNDDEPVAWGGDLSPERLINAYMLGIFPWNSFTEEHILWWCPENRFVIFPDEIHVSHSMRNVINKGIYKVTYNRNFGRVILECAFSSCGERRYTADGAWLGGDMCDAYKKLNEIGIAKSVEVWSTKEDRNDEDEPFIAGGLYGVEMGKTFVGESMFSSKPNASKMALICLARKMADTGGLMIDCQLHTDHLESMGGRFIPYRKYMDILERGLSK